MPSIARLAFAVVLSLALLSCSGGGTPQPRSACDLVTQAEVSQVIGSAASAPTPVSLMQPGSGSDPSVTACSFDTGQSFGQVVVTLRRPGRDAFDRARQARATDPTSFAVVDGLGQEAFATHEGVDVLVSDSYITVSAQNETPGFGAKAVMLARFAVSRAA